MGESNEAPKAPGPPTGSHNEAPKAPGPPTGSHNEAPRAPGPPTGSQSVVVAFRVLLLILAAAAVAAAVVVGLDRSGNKDANALYVCPMHSEVTAEKPSECPICGMALEPAPGRTTGPTSTRAAMAGMADMTAVENISKHRIVDFTRKHSLLFDARDLRGPAWVEDDHVVTAVLYNDQIDALSSNEVGSFSPTGAPRSTFALRRTADPAVAWDRSTSRIRFQLDAGRDTGTHERLVPGQVGWLELTRRSRDVLAVPASAILQSPEGPYVLAPAGSGKVEKRPIEIGETFLKQGFAVVLSGLRVHDRIVSRATFFLDADRRVGNRSAEGDWKSP